MSSEPRTGSLWIALTGLLLVLLAAEAGVASSPQLNLIMPRGVQRGHQHVLTFSGARLDEAQEVFLYSAGVSVAGIEQVDANNVKVTVDVAADCRLGEHVAQLRTGSGISEYRSFFVGALPEVAEVEPNNEFEAPQVIGHNLTVTGVIGLEDVDHYQITATAGQRISIEIEAIRLGTQLVDPYLAVLDEKRFEILAQDDTRLLKQDSFISFVSEADATYTILVRDSSYGGNNNCHYRMHVGNFPRPTIAFPAGGPAGSEAEIRLLGDPAGPIQHKLTIPAPASFRDGLFYEDGQGITPSPVAFRVNDLTNVFETEPNANISQPSKVAVPAALNGIIEQDNDHDWFSFTATAGQVLDIEVYAQRINSSLDPIINVYGPDKKHIQGNDDSRGSDSYLRFTAAAEGEYFLRVRDLLNRGATDFVYRIEIAPPAPALSLSIPPVARYSQYRQSVFVPQGNRFATLISASRGNFGGEIKLLQDQLPAGVTMHCEPMAANLNLMPVVFEATADAALSGQLVDLTGSHVDDAKNIRGTYANSGMFVLGVPNNAQYVGCRVDRLPLAIVKPLPFKLEIVQPKAPLVRDGSINIRVLAHRDEGFTKPITLQFPFRPPGVGTRGTVVIPEGQAEAVYPLNANGNAQIRNWPVYILGSSDVGGNAWASTQLAKLNVTERYVTLEMQRASCEQGQETQFVCKMNQVTAFEGSGTAELLGLPAHAESAPLTFDKTTEQLVFTVKTKPETPVGKHTGVFCRVTIPVEGEPVVATAGRSELQVDKPLPQKQAQPKPATPVAAAPTEKPLSRLEKLRKAAREQKGNQ